MMDDDSQEYQDWPHLTEVTYTRRPIGGHNTHGSLRVYQHDDGSTVVHGVAWNGTHAVNATARARWYPEDDAPVRQVHAEIAAAMSGSAADHAAWHALLARCLEALPPPLVGP
jgi:hypothetical protein